ncbi:hypothetical protein B0E53_03725 [Micromonospora sp. MH33]|uniref:hypothetical protein n=1 Tax=Micromonospora sp. MH33 TaxID=1945509 RepID=UPI000D29D994|nr:hypothetical protein [Micromonospora sp. MH33]PSK64345.1 hypothetical protein B0E53_03725 [Micromonospora sp. MH33]
MRVRVIYRRDRYLRGVVWRETTAPEWQKVLPVGDVTEVTIDLSKDNVFFGVRAVDRAGHRSPVAFPKPGS